MNRRSVLILLLILVLVGSMFSIVTGQAPGFVINNADDLADFGVQPSNGLITLVGNVMNHFIIDRADSLFDLSIKIPPNPFVGLMDQVGIHFVLDRADQNDVHEPNYPRQLINDQTPPKITRNTSSSIPLGIKLVVETDEFTTLEVDYGTTSGNYPLVLTDPLFSLNHEVTLPALPPGQAYYVVVKVTDRNDNLTIATEKKLTSNFFLFLPKIIR